ncbi:hypothetical protein LPB67_03215 [Undibacterium sp. Jales W-56]|uniref:hypothetical protein n=1 Tax=Undibacterium sp. Jales W-56 TaxID=2897325 RepID=UPI0021D376C0|nr:hypothetical protein [Undibacterium sp. Jales W-56]MCU6432786.1 hypothetical protein [Undibacterium sp. Jales W-56]
MSNQIDTSIPVLTEIIQPGHEFDLLHVDHADIGEPTSDQSQQAGISEDEWQKLEQTLRENVLRQVLARVDFVLEHRVRDSLADVLQTAVEGLALEIRGGLHKTIEEVITRAVTQEIAKAKISK